MRFTVGTTTTFTPDRGFTAYFRTDDETWTHPVIGWATVVTWAGHADRSTPGGDEEEHQVGIEPVMLVEGRHATPMTEYLKDLAGRAPTYTLHHNDWPDPKPEVEIRRGS